MVSRGIGWSNESNLLYQILKQITRLSSIIFSLKQEATPKYKVFTALLNQSGIDTESTINSGNLTLGVTYTINQDSLGMSFTNVGAPNNNLGTSFIATATTPISWGEGADYTLAYSEGAPVATILENTIGNMWFTYNNIGQYLMYSDSLYLLNKTTLFGNKYTFDTFVGISFELLDESSIRIKTGDPAFSNNYLINSLVEIRVYN